jgi:hypothetical protein
MFTRFQLGLGNALSTLFQMDRNQQLRSMVLILMTAFLMELASNALYEALALPIWFTPLLFVLLILGAILWFSWRHVQLPAPNPPATLDELPCYPGLILFLSLFNSRGDQQRSGISLPTWRQVELEAAMKAPVIDWPTIIDRFTHSNMQPALTAIQHHLSDGTLKHIWLISTSDLKDRTGTIIQPGSRTLAPLFTKIIREGCGWNVTVHYEDPALVVPPNDTTATYKAVEYIFVHASLQIGLNPSAIIADFTGGRAPMTAGMVLACAPRSWAMQYTTTDRDPAMLGPTDEPIPVGVDVKVLDLLLSALETIRRRVTNTPN